VRPFCGNLERDVIKGFSQFACGPKRRSKTVSLPIALILSSLVQSVACDCAECRAQPQLVREEIHKQSRHTRAETDSFSVFSYDSTWSAAEVGKLAQERRAAIYEHWKGKDLPESWQPKCVLVLHVSRSSYLAAVGRGGERSLGSSLLDVRQGVCRSRRIDLLTDDANRISALPHELTHVILSDIFSGDRLPRWLDEGIAILADSHDKQLRHAQDWNQAKAQGTAYSAGGLMGLEDYPRPAQFPAFYGGSASLTALLARRGESTKLLQFARQSLKVGCDQALREVYDIRGVAELETIWRQSEETSAYSLAKAAP